MPVDRNLIGCQRFHAATLPANWECVPLLKHIEFEYGFGLTDESRTQGPCPVYGSNGIVGTHVQSRVSGPGIVVGRKGTVGAISFSPSDFWPIDTCYYVVRKREDEWRYLLALLEYLDLGRLNAATGVPGLSRRDAMALRGAFPSPDEQCAIAAILDAADAVIEGDKSVLQQARLLHGGILHRFFRDALGPISSADRPGRQIAEGWRLVPTGQLLAEEPKNGVSPPAESQPPGTPTFSIGAVRDGRIDLSNQDHLKYVRIEEKIATKFAVRKGDILVVRGNANPRFVGKCGVVDGFPNGCIYPDILKRIVFADTDDGVLPDYAATVWNHPLVHNQVLKRAQTSNGTLKINSRDVKQIVLPVPPKEQQRSLMKLIRGQEELTVRIAARLNLLRCLKRGLMQDLLTGKVRVPSILEVARS